MEPIAPPRAREGPRESLDTAGLQEVDADRPPPKKGGTPQKRGEGDAEHLPAVAVGTPLAPPCWWGANEGLEHLPAGSAPGCGMVAGC